MEWSVPDNKGHHNSNQRAPATKTSKKRYSRLKYEANSGQALRWGVQDVVAYLTWLTKVPNRQRERHKV
eukprot:7575904-Karenia_brevis.AAC.1